MSEVSEKNFTNSTSITISDAAAAKILSLVEEENNPNLNLRVYITGGGCSGYQYGFTFDEQIQEGDTIIEKACKNNSAKIKLLVDCMSITLLAGSEI